MRDPETMPMNWTTNAPAARATPAEKPARAVAGTELTPMVRLNLTLRAVMEFGIVLALGIWGYHAGSSVGARLLLAIVVPAIGFGFWGAVDFRGAGRLAEPLRLAQELAVTGVAAGALSLAGHTPWGIALASLSLVHHALVYALGRRLLER